MDTIDALKARRLEAGLSQQTVASRMGTTQSALSRAEHGGNPTQDFLQRYDEALSGLTTTSDLTATSSITMKSGSTVDITTLKLITGAIAKKYGLAQVYLYGSFARGEADDDSDIDLLYVSREASQSGMDDLARLKSELERSFGREVSLTSLASLRRHAQRSRASRRFYEHIQRDMVRVV
ncbi:nucleotidyltransferase domain-containing protein [Bifidobacterium thermophilum]|uniref:nucleotidyltransferase domain-containing protein n=1 Tax=Bifidobacterium thermophilum TaxID=33905 RepID=UPI003F910052